MHNEILNASSYYQPTYSLEEREELVKCDCCYQCDSYSPSLMLDGYDGDRFYVGHKEQYLENLKGTLLQQDIDTLELKINKQL